MAEHKWQTAALIRFRIVDLGTRKSYIEKQIENLINKLQEIFLSDSGCIESVGCKKADKYALTIGEETWNYCAWCGGPKVEIR